MKSRFSAFCKNLVCYLISSDCYEHKSWCWSASMMMSSYCDSVIRKLLRYKHFHHSLLLQVGLFRVWVTTLEKSITFEAASWKIKVFAIRVYGEFEQVWTVLGKRTVLEQKWFKMLQFKPIHLILKWRRVKRLIKLKCPCFIDETLSKSI